MEEIQIRMVLTTLLKFNSHDNTRMVEHNNEKTYKNNVICNNAPPVLVL